MLPPKPFIAQCETCGWSKVYAPKSDVINGEICPDYCPSCRAGNISRKYSNIRVLTFIRRLIGN